MKRVLLCMWAVAMVALLAYPASAGSIDKVDQITLSPSPAKSFIFTGNGAGGFSLALKNVTGLGFGTGIFLGQNGPYNILQNGASITGSAPSCSMGACNFAITQLGNVLFQFGVGGSKLTGDLQFVNLTQTASTLTGVFNDSLVINLTNLSGTLASKFNNGSGIVQITLNFQSKTPLQSLLAGSKAFAQISTGSVNPTIPEPASLAIMGGGLLALAALGVKKKKLFTH
jgi:hypothetical protein